MKKESIRKQVFNAAWQIVEEKGMQRLSVRKVAELSGCSLGSVYNAFDNFEDLQMHIKAKILTKLFENLARGAQKGVEEGETLSEVLKSLGHTYINFGKEQLNLWKALFETFPLGPVPEWYKEYANKGVNYLSQQLAHGYALNMSEAKRIVAFFWTAIQGISSNLLNHKVEVVSEIFEGDYLNDYLDYCIEGLIYQKAGSIE